MSLKSLTHCQCWILLTDIYFNHIFSLHISPKPASSLTFCVFRKRKLKSFLKSGVSSLGWFQQPMQWTLNPSCLPSSVSFIIVGLILRTYFKIASKVPSCSVYVRKGSSLHLQHQPLCLCDPMIAPLDQEHWRALLSRCPTLLLSQHLPKYFLHIVYYLHSSLLTAVKSMFLRYPLPLTLLCNTIEKKVSIDCWDCFLLCLHSGWRLHCLVPLGLKIEWIFFSRFNFYLFKG